MIKDRFTIRAAVYLFLEKDNQVLLLRRFNTGWEDGKYTFVAGHLDGNEKATEAMAREAFEEAGIIVKSENLYVVHTMHRKAKDSEYIDFFVAAKQWEGEPEVKEQNKADHIGWFRSDHLPDNILPHVKKAIELVKEKISFSEVDWENTDSIH